MMSSHYAFTATSFCQAGTVCSLGLETVASGADCLPTQSRDTNQCCLAPVSAVYTSTHTLLTALCPGLPGWAGTRRVKPIWILLKQETVSGSGIRWAICKSASRSRQTTTPAPHRSVFYRPDALPAAQPTVSKHWRQVHKHTNIYT